MDKSKAKLLPDGIMTNELSALESGLYSAVDADGNDIFIEREKGHGYNVWRPTHNGWYEVVEYDENGCQLSVSYSK